MDRLRQSAPKRSSAAHRFLESNAREGTFPILIQVCCVCSACCYGLWLRWITFFVLLVLGGLLMVSALESILLVELATHSCHFAEAASFASLPMLLLAPQKLLDKKIRIGVFLYVDNL